MQLGKMPAWPFVAILAGVWTGLFSVNVAVQVSAHQEAEKPPQEADGDTKVASPMVVEMRLPEKFGSMSPRPGTAYQKEFTETRRYVCNTVRIERLKVSRTTDKKGRAVIKFEPHLLYRKDFRLKLEVVSGSETLLAEEARFDAPRGPGLAPSLVAFGASLSISETAELTIDEEKWKAAFSNGSAPIVRMTVTTKAKRRDRQKEKPSDPIRLNEPEDPAATPSSTPPPPAAPSPPDPPRRSGWPAPAAPGAGSPGGFPRPRAG